MLDAGHCQIETWALRVPARNATLLHLGPSCRVGPVELGLSADRFDSGAGHRALLGPQLKWVATLQPKALAAGAVWAVTFDARHGGRPLHTAYLPLTWAPSPAFALNLNAGADWNAAGARTRRLGVSGEWAPNGTLTLIGERVTIGGDWLARLGARLALGASTSVDLSVARLGPVPARVWAIGLNHDLGR